MGTLSNFLVNRSRLVCLFTCVQCDSSPPSLTVSQSYGIEFLYFLRLVFSTIFSFFTYVHSLLLVYQYTLAHAHSDLYGARKSPNEPRLPPHNLIFPLTKEFLDQSKLRNLQSRVRSLRLETWPYANGTTSFVSNMCSFSLVLEQDWARSGICDRHVAEPICPYINSDVPLSTNGEASTHIVLRNEIYKYVYASSIPIRNMICPL